MQSPLSALRRLGCFLAVAGLLGLATALPAAAQSGRLVGSVLDEQTGEPLIGAGLLLLGTSLGASTDLDGRFALEGVEPGSYDLRASFVGYESKVVTSVVVRPGESATVELKLATDAEAFVIEDMVVSAERVLSTSVAVLALRQQAAVIGDAISADMIARSPDATSGDALKRVTGLSVVDDKFVYIRGVTDRYNETSLNGVSVAGTDANVDKKSFSFDLIPASLIANTVVVKTATPDLPGDFSGGLVQVNTLEFPYRRVLNVGYSSSWSDLTTGKDMLRGTAGDDDWLGKDDGTRALPEGLTGNALARALPNNWGLRKDAAPQNLSLNLSYGDRNLIAGRELGYIGALTYKNDYGISEIHEAPLYWHPLLDEPFQVYEFDATQYTYSVLLGGLLNLHYKLSDRHTLSLKNNYNRAGKEKVSLTQGTFGDAGSEFHQTIEWDEREVLVNQLGGEHHLGARGGFIMNWGLNRSESSAEQPDRRHVEYDQLYNPQVMQENYRTWSTLEEKAGGGNVDIELPLREVKLKFGGLVERRDRDYTADAYAATPYADWGVVFEGIDSIFDPENFTQDEGEGGPELAFVNVSVFTGEYSAWQDLRAYYLMLDAPFSVLGESFRVAGGARVEDSEQVVDTKLATDTGGIVVSRIDKQDWLPSANLNYLFNEKTNLRLAYNESVNRPEFREMSDVLFYDFLRVQNVRGNPNLGRARIRNYDLRLETFPSPGDVLAISFFSKRFRDAIEESLIPNPERFVRTWFNSPKGRNSGMELEVRKSLGILHRGLAESYLSANYTRVHSAVEYEEAWTEDLGGGDVAIRRETRERVMQGQAPWTINVGLLVVEPKTDIAVNLLFNRIGRRLDAVADSRDQDEYEEPRDLLDLSVSKTFFGRYKLKFAGKNLKNTNEVYTQSPEGQPFREVHEGSSYSVSIGWNL
jgi:outer membrane receptor protein involved in Fe transport